VVLAIGCVKKVYRKLKDSKIEKETTSYLSPYRYLFNPNNGLNYRNGANANYEGNFAEFIPPMQL
jgi:hypothetical protein